MSIAEKEVESERKPSFLTIEEVAADLRVSRTTVYLLVREGKLPCLKVRGQWRVSRRQYELWQQNEVPESPKTPVVPLRRRSVAGGRRG
jgi:excisionase family DNA binding protein